MRMSEHSLFLISIIISSFTLGMLVDDHWKQKRADVEDAKPKVVGLEIYNIYRDNEAIDYALILWDNGKREMIELEGSATRLVIE